MGKAYNRKIKNSNEKETKIFLIAVVLSVTIAMGMMVVKTSELI